MNKKNTNIYAYVTGYFKLNESFFYGLAAMLLAVLSIYVSSVAKFLPSFIFAHWILLVLALILYKKFLIGYVREGKSEALKEILMLHILVCFLTPIILLRSIPVLAAEGKTEFLISELLVTIFAWGVVVQDCVHRCFIFRNYVQFCIEKIKQIIKYHKGLCGILLLFLTVGIRTCGNAPRWDAAYVYRYLENCSIYSIFYIPQLSFISHINFSYSALNLLAEVLTGDLWIGMTVLNLFFYLISGMSLYGICKHILPNKGETTYILCTSVYMGSPFLLGMINNNYWDYWMLCLFPVLFYFYLKEKWIWESVIALIFCFIKEPAVVVYAFMCLGILIYEWISLPAFSAKEKCRILMQKKYMVMLITGGIWIVAYIIMPNWNGNGGLAWDFEYIKEKLSVFFGLNFNWVLAIAGAMGFAIILQRSRKDKEEWIRWVFPLLLSDLAFIIFNCLFKTVNHARYIDSHQPVLFIFGLFGLCMVKWKRIRNLLLIMISLVMVAQSFFTIDPITKTLFDNYDVGNITMVSTTSGDYLADSMVYNQQYQYFDRALNCAMTEAIKDKNAVILFPVIGGKTWSFNGFAETTELVENYFIANEYWDNKKMQRRIFQTEDTVPLKIYNVSREGDWGKVIDGKTAYYFYVNAAGEDIAADIKKRYTIISEDKTEYGGWWVYRIIFKE